jgi:hypothetical protein
VRDTRVVRATGLEGEASVEIIDIIDDDINAFGDRAPSTTMYDTGGPRWIGPAAGAVLIALLLYGVATSTSSSGVPTVAPSPSTSVTRTTNSLPFATTSTIPTPAVPYYAAEPPRQFTVSYADVQEVDASYYGSSSYMLLATPGATATTGSWFSIELSLTGQSGVYAMDAYRVQPHQRSIAVSHTPSGQTLAQFTISHVAALTITAFGIGDDDLVRLAESISVFNDNIEFGDHSLVDGYQVLSTVYPWLALQGIPVEQVFYTDSNDSANGLTINVAPRPPANQGGDTLDRQIALRFFLDHATPFDVDGHVAVAGEVIGGNGYTLATWIAKDHIVTIGASMPVQELMQIARTVHPVSADEWSGMQFQATRHNGNNGSANFEQTTPMPVSYGTDANSKPWVIQVGVATFGDQKQVNWQWDGNGFGSVLDGVPRISSVVEDQRTYVLADLPRDIAATAQLQITRAGLDPVSIPFADTDASLDRTFAAYAFSEPTQYTAQIVGADGSVLANWPSQ